MKNKKRIKIAYIISHLAAVGPVNILYGIIKYLDFNKYEPYIITLKEEKENSREEEFKTLGVKIIKNITTNFKIISKRDKKIEKIIKDYEIDIVHSQCIPSMFLLSKLKLDKSKKVNTLHCNFKIELISKFKKIGGTFIYYLCKRALKKIDLNIICGKGLAKLLFLKTKVETKVIMNGIDTERINIKNIIETKESIRQELGIPQKDKVFIAVGSIDDNKNILYISNIFAKYFKNIYLLIIGTGEKKEELLEIVKKNKNILYLGRKNLLEVQKYLKASDYYVSASKSEGLPNSVLEALQFNLPVLLSDIEAHKEILSLDNKLGFAFKLNDVDETVRQIKKIMTTDFDISQLSKIKTIISAKRMAREYMEKYDEVLNEYI